MSRILTQRTVVSALAFCRTHSIDPNEDKVDISLEPQKRSGKNFHLIYLSFRLDSHLTMAIRHIDYAR